jgi:hypothetical protein
MSIGVLAAVALPRQDVTQITVLNQAIFGARKGEDVRVDWIAS